MGSRSLKEAAENPEVKEAFQAKGEEIGPLGVSGTMVAVMGLMCSRWSMY